MLLDSTTVLFGSGMGDANSHKNSDLPIILAGGGSNFSFGLDLKDVAPMFGALTTGDSLAASRTVSLIAAGSLSESRQLLFQILSSPA